jgi:hypothetical protein
MGLWQWASGEDALSDPNKRGCPSAISSLWLFLTFRLELISKRAFRHRSSVLASWGEENENSAPRHFLVLFIRGARGAGMYFHSVGHLIGGKGGKRSHHFRCRYATD